MALRCSASSLSIRLQPYTAYIASCSDFPIKKVSAFEKGSVKLCGKKKKKAFISRKWLRTPHSLFSLSASLTLRMTD